MKMNGLASLSLAFGLAACGGATAAPTETATVAETTEATLSSAGAEAASSSSTSQSASAPDLQTMKQRLASRWGFDGYVECAYYTISASADAISHNNRANMQVTQNMVSVMGLIKPMVVPHDTILEGAMKVFIAEHRGEPASIANSRFQGCVRDIAASAA